MQVWSHDNFLYASAAFLLSYTFLIAFIIPGATVLTLAAGVLFRQVIRAKLAPSEYIYIYTYI